MVEQDGRLGQALRQLIDVAVQDADGREALLELAAAITATVEAAMPVALHETADETVVPMDREELAALVERASSIEGGNAGPLADAIRAAAAIPPAPATSDAGEIIVPPGYQERAAARAQERDERRVERAAKLPALAERARVKAALTRSLAQDAAGGPALDLGLLHRARSVGATTWMADLRAPDAAALTQLADCFEALADMADYVTMLPPPHGATNPRFVAALRMMAAVLSAHRVTVLRFRQTPDEDQAAGFDWLRDTVAEERIFIAHHMRIEDPFDPAGIPGLMSSVHVELRALEDAEERQLIRQRGLGQLRYHAGLLAEGYGTDHDRDKVIEAVERLVAGGIPPSSLDLRTLLVPVREHLRPAAHPESEYGRVLTELDAHLAREAAEQDDVVTEVMPYSPEVDDVAGLLSGTSIVLIGGARRVEAEDAIREAFRVREVVWMSIDDDPTPVQLERAIRREDVSIALLLVRWARHAYGEAVEIADRHGKPFVRVEGGYHPNGLAHDILDQASERLRRNPAGHADD